ncbi:FlgD immunoglobulin-like domain containing protein [Calditrichota bacterium GD2]
MYLTSGPDKQQITISRTYNFSLKCVVTDSYNDQATSNILSVHVSGGALAKQSSEQTPEVAIAVPENLELNGNFPNPFNPTTTIKFGLPEDGYVQLNIYSMNGQKVRTLIDGQVSKGYHQIVWDGTNESGQWVSGGLYVYELKTDSFFETKKVQWRYYHNFTNN